MNEGSRVHKFLGKHRIAVSIALCIGLLCALRIYAFESASQKSLSATYILLITDFHAHTNLSDGLNSPAETVRIYKSYNYDVIAITDHVTTAGYEEARTVGQEVGLIVIRGEETGVALADGSGVHVTALFINTSIPVYRQSQWTDGLESFFAQIHAQNGIGIVAHPWLSWNYWKNLQYESYIDGWEYSPKEPYFFRNWLIHSDHISILTHDFHGSNVQDLPNYYTILLAHNRTEAGVREALEAKRIVINYLGKYYGTPGNLELFTQNNDAHT